MLFLGSDHAGFALKERTKELLSTKGLSFLDLTPEFIAGDDYPKVATLIASSLQSEADKALAFCGTGQGICIALNRFKNSRAICSTELEIIKLARQHNHANILCLPGRFLPVENTLEFIKTFLDTPESQESRHLRRLSELAALS